MCIVNETRCHGNITLVLKHNFPHEIAREKKKMFFHVILTVILFAENT